MCVLILFESAISLIMTSQKCKLFSPKRSLSNSRLRTYMNYKKSLTSIYQYMHLHVDVDRLLNACSHSISSAISILGTWLFVGTCVQVHHWDQIYSGRGVLYSGVGYNRYINLQIFGKNLRHQERIRTNVVLMHSWRHTRIWTLL